MDTPSHIHPVRSRKDCLEGRPTRIQRLPLKSLTRTAAFTQKRRHWHCLVVAGLALFACSPAFGMHRVQRQSATMEAPVESGRVVKMDTEKVKEVTLPNASVDLMDKLMKKEAVDILAAGAERTENAGNGGIWYAYMKPTKLGAWTNQVRLACKLTQAPSGSVNVDVVSFEVGSPDAATGEWNFSAYAKEQFSLQWYNSLTWEQNGPDLALLHKSAGKMRVVLPWWFPLPDVLVRSTFRACIGFMISDGQTKVAEAIRTRYQAISER